MSQCACGAPLPPSRYRPRKWCSERCRKKQYSTTEATRAATRRWAARNPERKRLGIIAWNQAHPESGQRSRLRRYRAKKAQYVEYVDRLVVLERDDGLCGLCEEDVDPFDFHIDHIMPLSKGGEHSYANTQVAHPRCNLRKRDTVTV